MNVPHGQAREEQLAEDQGQFGVVLSADGGAVHDAGMDAGPRTGVIQPWQTMTAKEQWAIFTEEKRNA